MFYSSAKILFTYCMICFFVACVPAHVSEISSFNEHQVVIGSSDTFIKRSLSTDTRIKDDKGSEFCTLYSHNIYGLTSAPVDAGLHLKINIADFMEKGCGFSEGYVFKSHLVEELPENIGVSSPNPKRDIYLFEGVKPVVIGTVRASELSPSVKAFLDTIAAAEGTSNTGTQCGLSDDGYGSMYRCFADTTRVFTNYNDHPRKKFLTPWGKFSDAAGRYQYLASTWDDVSEKLGLSDFSPANQDRGAANYLLGFRGAKSNVEAIGPSNRWQFNTALDKVACEWASIPRISDSPWAKKGGCHSQPIHSSDALWQVYKAAYRLYSL